MNSSDNTMFSLFDPEGLMYRYHYLLYQSVMDEGKEVETSFQREAEKRELKSRIVNFLSFLKDDVKGAVPGDFMDVLQAAIESARAATESGVYPIYMVSHFYLLALLSRESGIRALTELSMLMKDGYLQYPPIFAQMLMESIKEFGKEGE